MNKKCDILIIGSGIMGASLAYHLSQESSGSQIVCLDLEMTRGTFSSTMTNAGGARATWWKPLNIQLSLESMSFFKSIADKISYRELGYLWLYNNPDEWTNAQTHIKIQQKEGVDIAILTPDEVSKEWPHLRTDDLLGATWSPKDALLSSHDLWRYYIREARNRGVAFLNHHYVYDLTVSENRITQVKAVDFSGNAPEYNDDSFIKDILVSHDWSKIEGEQVSFQPDIIVNAAGAWTSVLSKKMGIERPMSARRRIITTFKIGSPPADTIIKKPDGTDIGMIVDPKGIYFHPEGGGILAGYSPADEPFGFDFTPGSEDFFLEFIYAPLADRFKNSEDNPVLFKMTSSWSGLYSYSPDVSLVMGPIRGLSNAFEIHSDTGKGIMHSYAAGRALAHRIKHGRYANLDFEIFSWDRFAGPNEKWLKESLHI